MRKLFLRIYIFIVLSVIVAFVVTEFGMTHLFRPLWEKTVEKTDTEESKGCFYLLAEDMKNLSDNDIPTYIEKTQKHFGYPLFLASVDDKQFSKKQRTKLINDEIVLDINKETLFKLLKNRNLVIGMGPISNYNFSLTTKLFYIGTIGFVIAAMTILWSVFSWRNLSRLADAAAQIGKKDFSARVKVPSFSSLGFLVEIFNNMAQRIERLLISHRELTNAVSHELLTPVSRIRFDIETLKNEVKTEIAQIALEGIDNDIDEIENLVTELLTYARFDRDGIQINLSENKFVPWMKQLIKDFQVCNHGINVNFNYSDNVDAYSIIFDPRLLDRALSNLLRNGLRFFEKQIDITFLHNKSEDIIHIDDDGPGIPEKERERVFEAFIRLDESRNRDSGGHGLGLAIVRQIISLHNGVIGISESPSGGARFTITLKSSKA